MIFYWGHHVWRMLTLRHDGKGLPIKKSLDLFLLAVVLIWVNYHYEILLNPDLVYNAYRGIPGALLILLVALYLRSREAYLVLLPALAARLFTLGWNAVYGTAEIHTVANLVTACAMSSTVMCFFYWQRTRIALKTDQKSQRGNSSGEPDGR